jgi:hypothetical protein
VKKIGGYIMLLLVLANLFAPIYADNSYAGVKKAEAAAFSDADSAIAKSAQDECLGTTKKEFCFASRYVAVGSKITLTTYVIGVDHTGFDLYGEKVVIRDATTGAVVKTLDETKYQAGSDGKIKLDANNKPIIASGHDILQENVAQGDFKNKIDGDTDNYDAVLFYTGEIDGLQENHLYNFNITVSKYNVKEYIVTSTDKKYPDVSQTLSVQTGITVNGKPAVKSGTSDASSGTSGEIMPACSVIGAITFGGITGDGTFMGCVAQAMYYVFFVPTSYIFALAGKFFDFTFKYTISDSSYRATFVVEGWKIVRDLCNIFFIFVLLMAAIKMILDVGHGAKDAIIKVVVIGLLINFSLFTTQIIVDSSNILARLFYNSDAIKITMMKNSGGSDSFNQAGVNMYSDSISSTGEIPISAAIVDKVNPQSIIINAKKIQVSDPANLNNPNGTTASDGIGIGAFILITLLATAVNLIGFFIFLSIGLMFVGRVIGLWFAMILVPLAFFSNTMPELTNMDYIGWKKWLPETLKLAFMAPVFMFFMYLILIFLDNSFLDLSHATSAQEGVNFILGIILPFAFIIILLNQAKEVAKSMSGKVGGMVTNYATAAGGMILGGAALGTAMLGRQTLGAVSKYAQNDGAREKAIGFASTRAAVKDIKGLNVINPFAYAKVATTAIKGTGQYVAAQAGKGLDSIKTTVDDGHGGTRKVGWYKTVSGKLKDKEHGEHVLNEYADKVKHGSKYSELDETDQNKVRESIDRDTLAKAITGQNKKYDALSDSQKTLVDRAKGTHATWNKALEAENHARHGTDKEHLHTASTMESDSRAPIAMSEFVNALRKGSYDVRNMSKMSTRSKGLAGFIVNTSAGLAAGMRSGLKDTIGINHGTGNKDFMKDMKEVLTEAFKTAKLEVKLPAGGGHGGGHDDHGGGHDDHGHGGGGHH